MDAEVNVSGRYDWSRYQLIDGTTDYALVVGTFNVESFVDRRVYALINKHTSVLEAIGPNLGASLTALYQFQQDLDLARKVAHKLKTEGWPEDAETEHQGFIN